MKLTKRIYTILIFLFLYAPILVLVIFSFNDSKSRGVWHGFTLKWYVELFRDREVLKAFYYTVLVAVISSGISTVIGTFAAIGIHGIPGIWKKVALNLNYLPILNADIVTAVSLMVLFGFMRLEPGLLTMIIAHITFCTPYVVLSVLPKLKQMNKYLPEAALDLGATPFYAFRKIVIPEIRPGIVTGALIAFTLSVDDFVISFFTTGNGVSNLSIHIFSMTRIGINPVINALSTLMFVTLLVLLLIINKKSNITEIKEEMKLEP